MTQETRRPMPGPPAHDRYARPHRQFADERCSTCYSPGWTLPKWLTDVECWAEHHHAEAAWAKAMLQVLMGYRPMTDELNTGLHLQLHETDIWHRFATRPHALEATP